MNILQSIYNRLIWPDRTIEFSIRAISYIKKMRLIDEHTKIISIGLPISTHIVGYYFKKKNKRITWIADYGDPYTFNPTKLEKTKRNYFFEKRLAKLMDKIVIPTKKAINSYEKLGVKIAILIVFHLIPLKKSIKISCFKSY